MNRIIAVLLILIFCTSACAETGVGSRFTYEHDPRENPRAMEDIVENPDAVYGFSPSPDSTRLRDYADAIDWTDPEQVAEARAIRQSYHDSMSELYRMIEDMLHEGKDVETIARAVSQRRNELRLEAEADDPEALALTKKSNLEAYGNELGPTPDSLYEKYGSWQTVLEKALGTNAGMDACLGFYDEYYDLYDFEAAPQADRATEEPETGFDDDQFTLWDPDAPALNALIEYVEAVTDPDSPDFIPEVDRIATFDMDGTLMAELAPTYLEVMLLTERVLRDASYQPDEEMLEFGRMTRDHALDKSFPDDYDYEFSWHQARAFAGMTLQEYADFVTRFLVHEADGFEGMTYADAYYLPMVEVIDYLQENGFKCYVVSGSDRFIVRTFIEGVFDIPAERVIGSDTALEARNQGDTDGIEYVFTGDDELVRTDKLIIKDLKTNKVIQIAQEIGRQPVLSFGNSSGDVSMNNYALLNNRYRSAAFMLVADDDVRDYGNPDKHDELTDKWQEMGYNVISMRDDWQTIYGEDVMKTGAFHWLQDYADDGIPADAGAAEGSVLDAIRARGVLRVGTAGDYRPMSYLDPETDTYVGFDAALAEDLAAALGVEIEYVATSWPTLMEDTLAGKFDLAICGITVTDARKEQALMSDGYLENGKTVLCRAEDADKYTSLDAINRPGVRVMENPGGLNEKFARENLPDATLIIHDVNQEIPGLVAAGEADVMITEVMEAGYYVGQDARLAAPLLREPFTHGQLGALMPKGSEDLLAYVNAFLEAEKVSGRLDELAEVYIYRTDDAELDEAA